MGSLSVLDRLRGTAELPVQIDLDGGLTVAGRVARVGADWLLLEEPGGREALMGLGFVLSIAGLGRVSAVPGSGGAVLARLTMRSALRGIAADRSAVRVHLRGGPTIDATIDRVGADFVEVARHAPGEARRRGEVRDVVLVPVAAIVAVRRSAG